MGLLTSGGTGFNKGDALCILSAAIFGLHKFRTESITARFDDTQELVAVQLVVLSLFSALATVPALLEILPNNSPGMPWPRCMQGQVLLVWPHDLRVQFILACAKLMPPLQHQVLHGRV